MKWIFILFLFLSNVSADEVKVDISPAKPVAGQTFQATFKIFTESSEAPVISFNPAGVEVVGKYDQGVSSKFVYANGRIVTNSRQVTIVYELLAEKPGTSFIRDIHVEIGGKRLRHNNLVLTILKEPEATPDIFIMAEVPKKSFYLGEGFVVRYYLYSRGQVANIDVKKYPKLNYFLKRFLNESENPQRVTVDGQMYFRHQIYTAKLFPERLGDLKIDSLEVSAQYLAGNASDPFSVFNMNRSTRQKVVRNEPVSIEVKPLPTPVPSHFTGLVGKHTFDLNFSQSKILVNQPLEVKLTVTGVGALENLEAPTVIKHNGLEEFETNGDLKITDSENGIKTFDFTFLAKENLNLPATTLTLSYLDPLTDKYVPVALSVPEIVVAGAEGIIKTNKPKDDKPIEPRQAAARSDQVSREMSGPIIQRGQSLRSWLPFINGSIAILAFILVLVWIVRKEGFIHLAANGDVPAAFKKGSFELGEFVRWMTPLIVKTGKSPGAILRTAPIDEDARRYFIDLLESNDYKNYSNGQTEMNFKYNAGHFKQLSRYIASVENDRTEQSGGA